MNGNILAVCFAVGTLALLGCQKADAPKVPPLPVAWWDESAAFDETIATRAYYLSWADGGSLAIVVPFWQHGFQPRSSETDDKQCVYVSVREGMIYRNGEPVLSFPPPDNRCYVLGADFGFHDSGRSAEWLCFIRRYAEEADGMKDEAAGPGARMLVGKPIPQRLLQEKEAFTRQLESLAFEPNTRFHVPWNTSDADVQRSLVMSRREPPSEDTPFHWKWDTRPLWKRPDSWKSNNARDDWSVYSEDEPPPTDPTTPVL